MVSYLHEIFEVRMNYIVFDMEWNQPPAGAKLEYENDCCLSNEIIQIGAVKIGEGGEAK